jgi:hypothetical protein
VRRGLSSPHLKAGSFALNEDAVHQWVTMIGRAYQDVPPGADLCVDAAMNGSMRFW